MLCDLRCSTAEHAPEMLRRAVCQHISFLYRPELVRLLDRLHDEARLKNSRFRVVGVVGEGRNNSLSVDVASFVHEPAWRFRKADDTPDEEERKEYLRREV